LGRKLLTYKDIKVGYFIVAKGIDDRFGNIAEPEGRLKLMIFSGPKYTPASPDRRTTAHQAIEARDPRALGAEAICQWGYFMAFIFGARLYSTQL
jgi:hypothetical protein